jgi:DegV family protein with EDD domain
MKIAYMDGLRFRRSLLAACLYIEAQRRELNRINVFPVPDGDTGTNLALTVRAISDHLRAHRDGHAGRVALAVAEAAVMGARGNSGMMLSHFLLGFAAAVEGAQRLTPEDFSRALSAGSQRLDAALDAPVEGTILTVIRDTAQAATALEERDFEPYLSEILKASRRSLERTPELLPVLKEAGVVDAGARGFVSLLEGVMAYVQGDLDAEAVPEPEEVSLDGSMAAAAHAHLEADETFRFCTEALVRGPNLPLEAEVREALAQWGDSVVVIRTPGLLKLHLHTDDPEGVFQWLRGHGTLVAHKAEDMVAQHGALARAGEAGRARRPLAIVTESAHDLPEAIIRAHGIRVVPLLLVDGDTTLKDGVDITSDQFHARLSEKGPLPTTSQPAPADFVGAFREAAEDGEEILYLGLSSTLSGTFGAAEAALPLVGDETPIHPFDTRAASLLQGMLVLRAAEMGEAGHSVPEILSALEGMRAHSNIYFTVDTLDRLRASGRVSLGKALIARLFNLKPILTLSDEGRIRPAGRARGRRGVMDAVLRELKARVPVGAPGLRLGIVHVACPEVVTELSAALREHYGPDVEIVTGPVTPVLATHLGIGAWGMGWVMDPPAHG